MSQVKGLKGLTLLVSNENGAARGIPPDPRGLLSINQAGLERMWRVQRVAARLVPACHIRLFLTMNRRSGDGANRRWGEEEKSSLLLRPLSHSPHPRFITYYVHSQTLRIFYPMASDRGL
jgi:hypothetical protein